MSFTVIEGDVTAVLYDASGNPVSVITDAGTYRLAALAKIQNASGGQINPATEETLGTRATESTLGTRASEATLATRATETTLQSVDGKVATETTLASRATEATLQTRATESTLATRATEVTLASIKNTDGVKKINDSLPAGENIIGRFRLVDGDGTNVVDVETDAADGKQRLAIVGKVSVSAPATPPSATPVTIAGDTPLSISTTQNTEYVIPDGETFTLSVVEAGAAGDPTEKGSKIEVIYDEDGTEKIIERIYITGQTVAVYPDTSEARDGTSLVGNAAGTYKIILRRIRLSGTSQEVDAVVRGYVQ